MFQGERATSLPLVRRQNLRSNTPRTKGLGSPAFRPEQLVMFGIFVSNVDTSLGKVFDNPAQSAEHHAVAGRSHRAICEKFLGRTAP